MLAASRTPLMRTGARGSGQFERVSWERALDTIHRRVTAVIERWGAQAVMPLNYAGPHGMLAYDSMSLRFFHRLGATQLYRGAMCGMVRSEAWAGPMARSPASVAGGGGRRQAQHCVGQQRHRHQPAPRAQDPPSRRMGGRLVVVDPLRSKIAEQADLHLASRPGTDVLLGFALAVELEQLGAHDRAFIAEHVSGYDEFMALARAWPAGKGGRDVRRARRRTFACWPRWMAERQPLVIAPGNGLERGRNGGSGIRAAIALPRSSASSGRRAASCSAPALLSRKLRTS